MTEWRSCEGVSGLSCASAERRSTHTGCPIGHLRRPPGCSPRITRDACSLGSACPHRILSPRYQGELNRIQRYNTVQHSGIPPPNEGLPCGCFPKCAEQYGNTVGTLILDYQIHSGRPETKKPRTPLGRSGLIALVVMLITGGERP